MDMSLKDKVAIVTGASHGLGRAIAGAYAAAGARAALYLASDLSDYVSGAILTIDGGVTASAGLG